MSEGLAISTSGLTKRYKQVVAVKHLGGTVFGFLEPNGAGKTTTIRMLRGLVRPSAGRAEVLGHDIVTDRRAARSSSARRFTPTSPAPKSSRCFGARRTCPWVQWVAPNPEPIAAQSAQLNGAVAPAVSGWSWRA